MTVYIDVLIVINVCVSYFTVRAVSTLLHIRPKFSRLAAASVFGGFSSLAALLDTGFVLSFLLRSILTVIMVFIAYGKSDIRDIAVRSFLCVCAGMLLCGACVLIHELTGSDIVFAANGYVYISVSSLVLVIASVVIYGALSVVRRLLDSPDTQEKVMLTAELGGRYAVMTAISDSGNLLRDVVTGRPVIVCSRSAAKEILPENVSAYLSGDIRNMSGIRLIPAETAAGSVIIAAFRPDSIIADVRGRRKSIDALLGVTKNALENEGFDAVIQSSLLK